MKNIKILKKIKDKCENFFLWWLKSCKEIKKMKKYYNAMEKSTRFVYYALFFKFYKVKSGLLKRVTKCICIEKGLP